ncbi:hypothetical protein ACMV_P1_02290 (plasmid) [Acidiphilium multivorum AIU301]|uniref:Polyvalent protein metallopeptidase domain-containing protein n=1 Tax=Acidiphilium multivorum (strain DSM 11245 / JCM 8867 / NBRC 100883 / AIU 301) TaxID=926570 RepID=F0J7F8_ACIMA|nr:hypothetical protein ACMV_P1_02290 [Acidiphilium multivorum AIU301]
MRHDRRAPCCWSDEDYAEWDWCDHTANRALPSRCGIIRISALCPLCRCRHKGHATGHPSRLNRPDLGTPFGSEAYAREELRAEIASLMIADKLGIGHDPGQHAAYVGSCYAQQWTLKKPDGAAQSVYNPLMQNETHRDVIRRVAQVPVRPLVILAGHVRLAGGPVPGMVPLTSAVMEMTRAGAASGRALAALETLARFRGQARQAALSDAHRRRMRRQKPTRTRQLWSLALGAALVFLVLAAEQSIFG